MNLAPILVQVYTRKKHFTNCIESLAQCKLAEQSHLFIASDAPKNEDDMQAVDDIRKYCETIKGFAKVDVLAYEHNLGALEASKYAQQRIFSEYSSMIFTEDDNIFSPNFLEFINEGLEYYKDNPNVFAICGYKHPFKMPKLYPYDIYASACISAWGFGVWKEKYLSVNLYPKRIELSTKQVKRYAHSFYELMLDIISKNIVYGDVLMMYHCIKNNMITIHPVISLVQNHGHDGSGEHCGINTEYFNQEICTDYRKFQFVNKINSQPNIEKRIANAIDYPFTSTTKLIKIKTVNFIKKFHITYKLYMLIKKYIGSKN